MTKIHGTVSFRGLAASARLFSDLRGAGHEVAALHRHLLSMSRGMGAGGRRRLARNPAGRRVSFRLLRRRKARRQLRRMVVLQPRRARAGRAGDLHLLGLRPQQPDRPHVGRLAWEQMSWLVYMPSASVSGTMTVDDRVYRLRGARGYHDHNWGEWIPGIVTWNWAQYSGPRVRVAMGDFPRVHEGTVGVDFGGRRTVFGKSQYRLTHSAWRFDAVNKRWFPAVSRLRAESESLALDVRFKALDTVPIVPPLDLPILPLVYEQTADITGTLWEKTPQGEWRELTSFAGTGFKEYTSLTTVPRQ